MTRKRAGWVAGLLAGALMCSARAEAGPETSMREFASSQIKKGVRALGMGGDGATLGNYALVWQDAGSAVSDYGQTTFADTGNAIRFLAVGFSTPRLWDDVGIFVVAMSEWGDGLRLHLHSPAMPQGAAVVGDGSDAAVFVKAAKPLGHGLSLGVLVGYEHSAFLGDAGALGTVRYVTGYRPSGGLGLTWAPAPVALFGMRALTSQDLETRTDATGTASGLASSWELRAGAAVHPWRGFTADVGWVGVAKRSALEGTRGFRNAVAAGVEQSFLDGHLALRAGWNETSPTVGASARAGPLKLDLAYVRDLGVDRTHGLFGEQASSVMGTLSYAYGR